MQELGWSSLLIPAKSGGLAGGVRGLSHICQAYVGHSGSVSFDRKSKGKSECNPECDPGVLRFAQDDTKNLQAHDGNKTF